MSEPHQGKGKMIEGMKKKRKKKKEKKRKKERKYTSHIRK